jgi:hypothetical protein
MRRGQATSQTLVYVLRAQKNLLLYRLSIIGWQVNVIWTPDPVIADQAY